MNFVFIAGRLGSDPETRFTPSGKKVTSFRVATNGKKKDTTIWWRVTVWGEQFDAMMPYLKKGTAVMIQGDLQEPKPYSDRENKPQCTLEITATNISFSPFGGKSEGNGTNTGPKSANNFESAAFDPTGFNFEPVMQGSQHQAFQDDEIPF